MEWNILATANRRQERYLLRLLSRYGEFKGSGYRDVVIGKVEDVDTFLEILETLRQEGAVSILKILSLLSLPSGHRGRAQGYPSIILFPYHLIRVSRIFTFFSVYYSISTFFSFFLASSVFGILISSTPSLNFADAFSVWTSAGRLNERLKEP